MNISEFAKPITAKSLNESLAKRFGKRIALESFTLTQLQDARNKLRTQLSQIEMSESFNSVVEGDAYQKNKLFLDVLNAELSERGDIAEDNSNDNARYDAATKKSGKKVSLAKAPWEKDSKAKDNEKPDFADIDGDGNEKESSKEAAKDKKAKAKANEGSMPQAALDALAKKNGKKKKKDIKEGAEDQAEIVMAAKDMVDRVTGWMEDTAEMKTESMLDLADAIRGEMGIEQSNAFVESIKVSLDELYLSLESTRGVLSNGVSMLTGEGEMPAAMGAEDPAMGDPEMDTAMEPTVDDEVVPADDDFDAAAPAAGGDAPAGRAQRESVDPRNLARKLSKKK